MKIAPGSSMKRLYFLGIGGALMGSLAQLASEMGFAVSGSDSGIYPPMSDQLAAANIEVFEGFDPAQLEPEPDLVVIGDTVSQTPRELQQVVEGAGRALDTVGSRRPLTLVVVGPRPDSGVLTALSRHARVLPVGEAADEDSLRNWLAVLMPLKMPTVAGGAGHAPASLDALAANSDPLTRELLDTASQGIPGAVAELLYGLIDAPFEGFDFEDDTGIAE